MFLLPRGQSEWNKLENILHWYQFSIFLPFLQSFALFVLRLNRLQVLRQHVTIAYSPETIYLSNMVSSRSQTKFTVLLPVQDHFFNVLFCFSG